MYIISKMNINDQSTGDDFKKLAEIEKELGNKELKEKVFYYKLNYIKP